MKDSKNILWQWGTRRSAGVRRVAVVLALLVVAFGAEGPPTEREIGDLTRDKLGPMVGRYQLLNARYDLIGSPTPTIANELFRIDTVTGRTWQFKSGRIGKDVLHNWEETFEADELKALKSQRNAK